MRALILALLLLPTLAHAADPWGDRLRQVFPNARIVETYDDYQPWVAYNPGHFGEQTTRLPVRMDGSPGLVWYVANSSTRTEHAIKDHGAGNSVTGQSLMLSLTPTSGGVGHVAYQFGTATPQSGLKEAYIFWRMKLPHNVYPTAINSGVGTYSAAAQGYAWSTPKFASIMHGLTAPNMWDGVQMQASGGFPRAPYGVSSMVPQLKPGGTAIPGYQTLQFDYRDGDQGSATYQGGIWAQWAQPADWYTNTALYPRSATGTNGERCGFQTDVWFGFEMRLKLVDEAMGADEMQLWYITPEGVKTELFNRKNMWFHNIEMSKGHTWNALFMGGNATSFFGAIDSTMAQGWFVDDLIVNNAPISDAYFAELAAYKDGGTVVVQPASYYVSPTGNDSNDGKTPQTAWQTISKVNSVDFVAGDVIRFDIGDYGTTTLTPKTSGSADGIITFTSYAAAATKPTLRGGVDLNGRNYVKIDGLDVTSTGITFSMSGATHNILSNNTIYSTATSWSPTISVRNGSHYNQITGNTISQAPANNDIINLRNDADNNLIADNIITIQGSHAAIDIEGWTLGGVAAVGDRSGNNNIIRGNKITGHNGGGVHITIQANSFGNLIEKNELKGDSTVGNYCYLSYPSTQPARTQALMKGVGEHNIIRNNILSNYPCQDSEGMFFDVYTYDGFTNNALNNHIYNNVITGIGSGATGIYFGVADSGTHSGNVIKNNILSNNGGLTWTRDADGAVSSATALFQMRDSLDSNFYDNNIFYTSQTNGAVIWLGGNYYSVGQADNSSTKWNSNLQVDPLLDAANFLPLAGSPAINAGADLTTITSGGGTGNTFTVADAYYFCDGNGVTTGDVIEVNGQHTAITDITYGAGQTGTLTVSPAITWTQGMGVNLPFNGTAPPIGLTLQQPVPDDGGDHTPPVSYARPGEGYPMPITLSASEPAAIYYTVDGSDPVISPTRNTYTGTPLIINVTTTLRFYAQDVAGNAETPQSVTYTITMPEEPKKPTIRAAGRTKAR